MNHPPPIGATALALGATLLLLDAALSAALRLGLARSLLLGGVRALVQMLAVGLVLASVFAWQSPWLIGAVLLFMLASASYEVHARQSRRLAGWWGLGVGAGTMCITTMVATALALIAIGQQPWWTPQVLIPLAGIVLGTVMNSVSVTLHALTGSLVRERNGIEARLALGATRHEALRDLQRAAVRTGVIPAVNQMNAAGIITLPGMMTGQVLAGMAPFDAAKYQILVLFLLGGGAALGAIAVSHWAVWRVTDERDRLRLDRLADSQPRRRR